MTLKSTMHTSDSAPAQRGNRAVALVITLLMLSVITFLAVAFISMTRRDKTAVTASQDLDTARTMSDAALARAQAQVVAQMMTNGSILNFDYTTSHNYINTNGFDSTIVTNNFYNVNYDWFLPNGSANSQNWAQNIANLFFDPRPPVFVLTNGNLAQPSNDFRYWVDLNRNGMFESNGLVQMLDQSGRPIPNVFNFYNGEPEWIGMLKYPETNHSANNPFVGRYAFMVLPIGKTLDWNFIHNNSRNLGSIIYGNAQDGFIRDQGVGSWELNLAALLNGIGSNAPNVYGTGMYPTTGGNAYSYNTLSLGNDTFNGGWCFNDAVQFIRYRYTSNPPSSSYPQCFTYAVATNYSTSSLLNLVDEYSASPRLVPPFDYNQYNPSATVNSSLSWPGSLNTNMYYDVQDLFDTTKTGVSNANPNGTFSNRFMSTMTNLDTYDRYTMQRLLACIGTGSAPEYGVYVHDNYGNLVLTNKINVNFDNTAQISAGPWAPMSTNLTRWNALTFFTNAADLLLRSQSFIYTNWQVNINGFVYSTNYFGITNIPVCMMMTNNGIVTVSYLYNEQIHRMLQLAANIYDAINNTNQVPASTVHPIYYPSIFRPELQWVSNVLTIVGYQQVTDGAQVYSTMTGYNFLDMTNTTITPNSTNCVWGVPWVVGANKGLPEFNGYGYTSRIFYNRQLLFIRQTNSDGTPNTNAPPAYTNQFYVMCISNNFGVDAWNPYTNIFYGKSSYGLTVVATNYVTITLTNNDTPPRSSGTNFATNFSFGNSWNWPSTTQYVSPYWPGYNAQKTQITNEIKSFLQTNLTSISLGYYSEHLGTFIAFTNASAQYNPSGYLTQDLGQTHWPVHNWTLNITNHVCYALFDGPAASGTLLDFVNLGPFGSSVSISNLAYSSSYQGDREFYDTGANDTLTSPMSFGLLQQIKDAIKIYPGFANNLNGTNPTVGGTYFNVEAQSQNSVLPPYYITDDKQSFAAADPFVHYTVGDLIYPGYTNTDQNQSGGYLAQSITNSTGTVTKRYTTSVANNNIVFGDQGLYNSELNASAPNFWNFPTNLLPGIGWLGRIHRGTPWQTIYLKSDDPNTNQSYQMWTNTWVNSQYTYPTNDWALLDLFTATPNDNAARGLLSVNQTNDAAWAAVFAGVVVPTNATQAGVIAPADVAALMDGPNGINVQARTNYAGGVFPHIGSILQASALTVNSPFLAGAASSVPDEIAERIPQQTLSLLKLGLPQFVIYSWGQSLRPKNVYSGGPSGLTGICTNYEVTGEFLTRTVCHVISTGPTTTGTGTATAPRVIVDSYNIMPGN
jgi:hypothetical protein